MVIFRRLVSILAGLALSGLVEASVSDAINAYELKEFDAASRGFLSAARAGDPTAQFYLGLMYNNGQGVERDVGEATRWLQQSAANGYAPARNVLRLLRRERAQATMVPKGLGGGEFSQYRVQLGAYREAETAKRVWNELQTSRPDLLQGLQAKVQRANLGKEKGVFYRLRVGPFATSHVATKLCNDLMIGSRPQDCITVAE